MQGWLTIVGPEDVGSTSDGVAEGGGRILVPSHCLLDLFGAVFFLVVCRILVIFVLGCALARLASTFGS